MPKYRSVVFLQGDDFQVWYDYFDANGYDDCFEYLLQWEYGEGEVYDSEPWGSLDKTYESVDGDNKYVVSYNYNLSYVSLTAVED